MSAVRPYDLDLLRKSFEVAKKARDGGDHPFGSVLGDETGALLMEQGNGYSAEGGDRTAHAERLLASRAAKAYPLEKLAKMTLYLGRTLRHVRWRDLLGWHWPRRLRSDGEGPKGANR